MITVVEYLLSPAEHITGAEPEGAILQEMFVVNEVWREN